MAFIEGHGRVLPSAAEVEAAEALALTALAHLLGDQERSSRFLQITGLTGPDLPGCLQEPSFLGGILDFVLEDETLLGEVAAAVELPPDSVRRARLRLPGAAVES
jgi:hypothetical protein